jgi:polysaccharide export outer membrane protein
MHLRPLVNRPGRRVARRFASVLVVAWVVDAAAASGQTPIATGDPGAAVRTRADLERLLGQYEQALASPAYSESVKRAIRVDAERIRARLRDGDFRTGDRIFLQVQGEPNLPDTVAVEPGPKITLPLFGEISLQGVLRSEIAEHLRQALSRYIRDPVVRANGLMRLAVIGSVARPGFYTMPAEMLLGEALMYAGGPTSASNLDEIRIERGAAVLLEGEALREAMREGLTLDQLNLQAGDQIVVPERAAGGWLGTAAMIAGVVGSLSLLVFQLLN